MASRKAEALAIVARARRIGWKVEQMDEGTWRIACPDRHRVQVHMTPSDRNHARAVLHELNTHGFAQAEKDFEAREAAEKAAKLEADRQRANDAARKLEARSRALAKAAGPYGQAQVTIAELLKLHPAPVTWHRVLVTPEMAKALLERNTSNRPISRTEVAVHATNLRKGRWRYNHQGVALDTNGVLQDGQHRLTAIVETGIAAEMMVSAGWPPENFAVIDTNRRRTASQVLGMGGAKYATATSTVARLLHLYGTWGPNMLSHANDKITNDLVVETYVSLDEDRLLQAHRGANRIRVETKVSPTGIAAALYLIFEAAGKDHAAAAHNFVDDVVDGSGGSDDPVKALHRQFTRSSLLGARHRLPAHQTMALTLKAWNLRLNGQSKNHLQVRPGSTMPQPETPTRARRVAAAVA